MNIIAQTRVDSTREISDRPSSQLENIKLRDRIQAAKTLEWSSEDRLRSRSESMYQLDMEAVHRSNKSIEVYNYLYKISREDRQKTSELFNFLGLKTVDLQIVPINYGSPVRLKSVPIDQIIKGTHKTLNKLLKTPSNVYCRYNEKLDRFKPEQRLNGVYVLTIDFDQYDNFDKQAEVLKSNNLYAPNFSITSGNVSLQMSYVLDVTGHTRTEVENLVKDVCAYVGSDPNTTGFNHAFRIPGFANAKTGRFSKVLGVRKRILTLDEFRADIPPREKKADFINEPEEEDREFATIYRSKVKELMETGVLIPLSKANSQGFADYQIKAEDNEYRIWINHRLSNWGVYSKLENSEYPTVCKILGLSLLNANNRRKAPSELRNAKIQNNRYVQIPKKLSRLTAIESPTGTGKTQATKDVVLPTLREGLKREPNVAYISARVALTHTTAANFNAENYQKSNPQKTAGQSCSITPQYLAKSLSLEDIRMKDVFIFDEVYQTFRDILTGSHIDSYTREGIIFKLKFILKTCNCIFLDANIPQWVINWIECETGETVQVIQNEYKNSIPITVFPPLDKGLNLAVNALMSDIESGHRIVVPTDTKTFALNLKQQIIERHPSIKIYCQTSDRDNNDRNIFMANPDKYCENNDIQVLIFSPSIDTGIDLNSAWFDRLYGFYKGLSIDAIAVNQQLARLRINESIDIQRFVWVNQRKGNFPSTKSQVLKALEIKLGAADDLKNSKDVDSRIYGAYISFDNISQRAILVKDEDEAVVTCAATFQAEHNLLMNNFRLNTLKKLESVGYALTHIEIPIETIEATVSKDDWKASKENIKRKKIQAILEAENIDEDKFNLLRTKADLTPSEQSSREKYVAQRFYHTQDVTDQQIDAFINEAFSTKIKLVESVLDSEVMYKREEEKNNKDFGFLLDKHSAIAEVKLIHNLGLSQYIYKALDGDMELRAEDLIEIGKNAIDMQYRVKAILGINCISKPGKPFSSRQTLELGKKLLNKLGLPITSSTKKEKGKTIRVFSVEENHLGLWIETICKRSDIRKQRKEETKLRNETNLEPGAVMYYVLETEGTATFGYRVIRLANDSEGQYIIANTHPGTYRAVIVENIETHSLLRVAKIDLYRSLGEYEVDEKF